MRSEAPGARAARPPLSPRRPADEAGAESRVGPTPAGDPSLTSAGRPTAPLEAAREGARSEPAQRPGGRGFAVSPHWPPPRPDAGVSGPQAGDGAERPPGAPRGVAGGPVRSSRGVAGGPVRSSRGVSGGPVRSSRIVSGVGESRRAGLEGSPRPLPAARPPEASYVRADFDSDRDIVLRVEWASPSSFKAQFAAISLSSWLSLLLIPPLVWLLYSDYGSRVSQTNVVPIIVVSVAFPCFVALVIATVVSARNVAVAVRAEHAGKRAFSRGRKRIVGTSFAALVIQLFNAMFCLIGGVTVLSQPAGNLRPVASRVLASFGGLQTICLSTQLCLSWLSVEHVLPMLHDYREPSAEVRGGEARGGSGRRGRLGGGEGGSRAGEGGKESGRAEGEVDGCKGNGKAGGEVEGDVEGGMAGGGGEGGHRAKVAASDAEGESGVAGSGAATAGIGCCERSVAAEAAAEDAPLRLRWRPLAACFASICIIAVWAGISETTSRAAGSPDCPIAASTIGLAYAMMFALMADYIGFCAAAWHGQRFLWARPYAPYRRANAMLRMLVRTRRSGWMVVGGALLFLVAGYGGYVCVSARMLLLGVPPATLTFTVIAICGAYANSPGQPPPDAMLESLLQAFAWTERGIAAAAVQRLDALPDSVKTQLLAGTGTAAAETPGDAGLREPKGGDERLAAPADSVHAPVPVPPVGGVQAPVPVLPAGSVHSPRPHLPTGVRNSDRCEAATLLARLSSEPIWCFETSCKLLHWCFLSYSPDPRMETNGYSARSAMRLLGLSSFESVRERVRGSRLVAGWSGRAAVLAFRGTASTADVLDDVRVWRTRWPRERPSCGDPFLEGLFEREAWWRPRSSVPKVHAGFVQSFEASGMRRSVLGRVEAILREAEILPPSPPSSEGPERPPAGRPEDAKVPAANEGATASARLPGEQGLEVEVQAGSAACPASSDLSMRFVETELVESRTASRRSWGRHAKGSLGGAHEGISRSFREAADAALGEGSVSGLGRARGADVEGGGWSAASTSAPSADWDDFRIEEGRVDPGGGWSERFAATKGGGGPAPARAPLGGDPLAPDASPSPKGSLALDAPPPRGGPLSTETSSPPGGGGGRPAPSRNVASLGPQDPHAPSPRHPADGAGPVQPDARAAERMESSPAAARCCAPLDAASPSSAPHPAPFRLYITGHSLGGALATLVAVDIALFLHSHGLLLSGRVRLEVHTFGAPRTGNRAFCRVYEKLVPATWHVINAVDTVTSSGKFYGLYKRCGNRVLINPRGDLIVRPGYLEQYALRSPGMGSVRDHFLTSYRASYVAILLAQLGQKGLLGGRAAALALLQSREALRLFTHEAFEDEHVQKKLREYSPLAPGVEALVRRDVEEAQGRGEPKLGGAAGVQKGKPDVRKGGGAEEVVGGSSDAPRAAEKTSPASGEVSGNGSPLPQRMPHLEPGQPGGETSRRPEQPLGGETSRRPEQPPGGETSRRPEQPPGGETSRRPEQPPGGETSRQPEQPPGGASLFDEPRRLRRTSAPAEVPDALPRSRISAALHRSHTFVSPRRSTSRVAPASPTELRTMGNVEAARAVLHDALRDALETPTVTSMRTGVRGGWSCLGDLFGSRRRDPAARALGERGGAVRAHAEFDRESALGDAAGPTDASGVDWSGPRRAPPPGRAPTASVKAASDPPGRH